MIIVIIALESRLVCRGHHKEHRGLKVSHRQASHTDWKSCEREQMVRNEGRNAGT